jgi:hypothetical protein
MNTVRKLLLIACVAAAPLAAACHMPTANDGETGGNPPPTDSTTLRDQRPWG